MSRTRAVLAPVLVVTLVLTFACALMVVTGCQKNYQTAHPGAVSSLDAFAFERLFEAQSAIDEAKAQVEKGALPAESKPAVNALVKAYNVARATWLTYRHVVQSKGDASDAAAKLQTDIAALSDAVGPVVKLLSGKSRLTEPKKLLEDAAYLPDGSPGGIYAGSQ